MPRGPSTDSAVGAPRLPWPTTTPLPASTPTHRLRPGRHGTGPAAAAPVRAPPRDPAPPRRPGAPPRALRGTPALRPCVSLSLHQPPAVLARRRSGAARPRRCPQPRPGVRGARPPAQAREPLPRPAALGRAPPPLARRRPPPRRKIFASSLLDDAFLRSCRRRTQNEFLEWVFCWSVILIGKSTVRDRFCVWGSSLETV